MDLLRNAYSNSSDEDEEEKPKRLKSSHTSHSLILPGSYVSKRQRAASSLPHHSVVPISSSPSSFTLSGTLRSLFYIHVFF